MYYIATFYSHFGAIRFKREAKGGVMDPRLMPVPRDLSSSCGTCVRFCCEEEYTPLPDPRGEIEQIVKESEDGYIKIYQAE